MVTGTNEKPILLQFLPLEILVFSPKRIPMHPFVEIPALQWFPFLCYQPKPAPPQFNSRLYPIQGFGFCLGICP